MTRGGGGKKISAFCGHHLWKPPYTDYRLEAEKSKWDSAATDDEKAEPVKPEVDSSKIKKEKEDSDLR